MALPPSEMTFAAPRLHDVSALHLRMVGELVAVVWALMDAAS